MLVIMFTLLVVAPGAAAPLAGPGKKTPESCV
jgi:hypothetical protein